MKNAKFIYVILVFFLLLVGCNNNKHVHEFTEEVVEPTYTSDGYTIYTCECGETYRDNYVSKKLFTEGLEYALSSDEKSYTLTGIGKATTTVIIIPEVFNGLPVTTIGEYAFSNCRTITNVIVPNSVTTIGFGAFDSCISLQSLTIPFVGNTKDDDSNTHIGYIFGAKKPYLENNRDPKLVVRGDYLPVSLRKIEVTNCDSIGYGAFACSKYLDTIILPEQLTTIGEYAFSSCTALKKIVFPESVTTIGNGAFSYCGSLTSITIPEGIKTISENLFYACGFLESINLPEKLEIIEHHAFYKCELLKSIIIPDSVATIGAYAFMECIGLINITIPSSITNIEEHAFSICDSLTNVYYKGTLENWCSITIYYSNLMNSAQHFFMLDESNNYKEVTELEIPSTVTTIGICQFSGFKVTSVIIPDSITDIKEGAFLNCNVLETIIFPENITSIGESAFRGCSSLKSITLPNGITCLEKSLFSDCENLETVIIPNSVSRIKQNAFNNCFKINNLILPISVKYIEDYVFTNCSALSTIYYEGTEEQFKEIYVGNMLNYYFKNATIIYNYIIE